ncbi:MAG TPA: TolC family protein [Polyangiaceae bacterium]|nr:TolC family protein [Polyangiaceae bacterium]
MKVFSFAVLCVTVGIASPAFAEASGVDAFVTEVLARNPTLRARTLTRDAAGRDARAEGLWPDPEVAVMFDQFPQHDEEAEPPMIRYQLSQMVPWPGKLGLMETAAERRTDASQADANTQRLDLVRDAKRAYWMLLMNKGLRDVNTAGRGLLDTIASAALARYGAGTGGHHEAVRAQVEQIANEVEAIDLEGDRLATLAMINALRNAPAEAQMSDPLEPAQEAGAAAPSLAQLERLALERRPELGRMRAMQREELAMAALSRRERYPDLMTSVWYNQMLGMPDSYGVMVGATVPLFNVGRQNRRAEASELRAGSAGSELSAMQNMIRFEIADASRKLVTAERTLALIRGVAAPRANQSFVSALAGFSTGSVEIVGVLDAWRALQSIERARVEAVVTRLMAIADLERAIGGSLQEVSR